MIGGGKDNIYVCFYYDGDEYYLIDHNNKNDRSSVPVMVGQVSGKLKKHCVGLEQLLPAIKLFCDTWSPHDNPDWEMEQL
jgi:hypothetical protein